MSDLLGDESGNLNVSETATLRDRIAAALKARDEASVTGIADPFLVEHASYDELADAVIAELDLENRIASAVQGYAQSEMVGIDYHDPMHRETAYEAMEKLNREAVGIARYAMKYRRPDGTA